MKALRIVVVLVALAAAAVSYARPASSHSVVTSGTVAWGPTAPIPF
jgi:hypothetical protein